MTKATTSDYFVYVGTYAKSSDKAIYQCRLNLKTGSLQIEDTTSGIDNPSYLAIHPNNQYLYSVNELMKFDNQPSGYVSAFSINQQTGKLTFINRQPSLGALPCHISVTQNNYVLVANYMGGNATALPILSDGSLGEPTGTIKHKGSSVNSQRQEAPHAHCIMPDNKHHIFVADLGIDKVMIHRLNPDTGELEPNHIPWVQIHSGAGPRQISFHPNGRFAYLINELDCSITAFDYDSVTGALKITDTVSTLPEDSCKGADDTGADIHVHPSGMYLYGSNRGHNSIVIYKIDQTSGRLSLVGHQSTFGDAPRNFVIDPSGTLLLVANQTSDTIVSFRIDDTTGKLIPTGHTTAVPAPVCIKMIPISR